MATIKEEAVGLEHSCLTDEAFQHRIGYLCVAVQSLGEQIGEAETGIERFVQNSYKKWKTYFDLQQDFLRLYTAKTIDSMGRTPKMDRASNFNVIKISAHHINITYKNDALVKPSPLALPIVTTAPEGATPQPPSLEVFATPQAREVVTAKATELVRRFGEVQEKIRVYQAHYVRLGNLPELQRQCVSLRCKMDEVATFIEQTVKTEEDQGVMRWAMERVAQCFDEMCKILSKERENCSQYMLNTVNRFIECSTTYNKVLAHLRLYNLELDCLRKEEEEEVSASTLRCASMYFPSDMIS
ncbi:MAG: hypothetical protein ABIP79_14005 [Chitinophagaceae bacterium]